MCIQLGLNDLDGWEYACACHEYCNFISDFEVVVEWTLVKFADDTKLESCQYA